MAERSDTGRTEETMIRWCVQRAKSGVYLCSNRVEALTFWHFIRNAEQEGLSVEFENRPREFVAWCIYCASKNGCYLVPRIIVEYINEADEVGSSSDELKKGIHGFLYYYSKSEDGVTIISLNDPIGDFEIGDLIKRMKIC